MNIVCAGMSDIGRKRKTNQDSIYVNNAEHVYIVADGMGGHSGGDLASTMAIKHFADFIEEKIKDGRKKDGNLVKEAALHANLSIKNFADENEALHGMGTTFVGIVFNEDGDLTVVNVGDSRAYMIKDGQIFQLTRDHSMVQEKLNLGIYNRDQAQKDPHKNVLSRTVGYEENLEIDIFNYKPSPGEFYLVCSDGLHGKLSDEDILYIIKQSLTNKELTFTTVRDCVQTLVRQANENGGQDNISVIIAATQ